MQNANAIYAPRTSRPRSIRYTGLVFTALVNGVVIWAIMNGLHFRSNPPPPPDPTIRIINPDVQSPPPMKQPFVKLVKPTVLTPPRDTAPPPIFKVETPQPGPITVTAPQPLPPPANQDSAASGMMDTHTTPPYPAGARNLSQQGTVTLALAIDATGAVTNAQVKTSSGSAELDQTAVNWVIAHWRYKPAIQSGAPVASTSLAAVKFDLRQAR